MSRNHNKKPNLNLSKADVDIVTPVYGSVSFLKELGDSLFKFDAGCNWTWTIVDDLGPEQDELRGVVAQFKQDTRVRYIRNNKNSGFAASNNQGFKGGNASLLLMLNSDTRIVHDRWLSYMVSEFRDPYVGVVGARLQFFPEEANYPAGEDRFPGKVQHAGVVFNIMGQPYHIFRGWDIDHQKVVTRREMNCVTGACLLTRRSLYSGLGGLNIVYGTGNFEDVEYCLSARMSGQKVIYQPMAQLWHYAGGSGNSMTARRNAQLFELRCSKIVEYDEWRYW